MASPAPKIDPHWTPAALNVPSPRWTSGEVHGPVADLHRTIENKLRLGSERIVFAPPAPGPIDQLLHALSRAAGWSMLLSACVALGLLLR